jgi:uncharacterized membrane protein
VRQKLIVSAIAAAVYSIVGLVRHWHFGSNAYDLGIADQMVWHLSRFESPASTIHGLSNMFGDHFSPIWILMAPLFWIHASPETLIVAQGLLLAASILPVWAFLERKLPAREAGLLAVAYALFWGMQRGAQFDVHELMFAPVLIAWMLLEIDKGRARYIWPAILLCLVKEDQIPLVAAAAALAAWRATGRVRTISIVASASALALFVAVVKVVIPALSDTHAYSIGSAFDSVLAHPLTAIPSIINPTKLNTLLMWLLPFAFMPLASQYGLLLVPLAMERFLSASPNHWGTSFHYSLPVAAVLVVAAGDGLANVKSKASGLRSVGLKNSGLRIAGLCVLVSAFIPGHQPMWELFSPSFYARPAFADAAGRALALIPKDAAVLAQSAVGSHLSERDHIYMIRGDSPPAPPDFVIAAPDLVATWPLPDAAAVRAVLDRYSATGYTRLFDEAGFIVLKK